MIDKASDMVANSKTVGIIQVGTIGVAMKSDSHAPDGERADAYLVRCKQHNQVTSLHTRSPYRDVFIAEITFANLLQRLKPADSSTLLTPSDSSARNQAISSKSQLL